VYFDVECNKWLNEMTLISVIEYVIMCNNRGQKNCVGTLRVDINTEKNVT